MMARTANCAIRRGVLCSPCLSTGVAWGTPKLNLKFDI